MKKILIALGCVFFSLPIYADRSGIYAGAYGGYAGIQGAYGSDGQFFQSRLALGIRAIQAEQYFFGAEVGVQSGNFMALNASSSVVAKGGGLVPQAVLKPVADFLVTIKATLTRDDRLFGILKGGIAYQRLQLTDRTSWQDTVTRANPEVQVGFGLNLTKHSAVVLFYQGIYGTRNANVQVDRSGNNTTISSVPTQQAGFIGFEYSP